MQSGTVTKLYGFLVHLTQTRCPMPNPLDNVRGNAFGTKCFFLCTYINRLDQSNSGQWGFELLLSDSSTQKLKKNVRVFSWPRRADKTNLDKYILAISKKCLSFEDLKPVESVKLWSWHRLPPFVHCRQSHPKKYLGGDGKVSKCVIRAGSKVPTLIFFTILNT